MQISDDAVLAKSRAMLLETGGWSVDCCLSRHAKVLSLKDYDLLLFCQTVSTQLAGGIALAVTACSQETATLRIAWHKEPFSSIFQRTIVAPVSPRLLLESAWRLVQPPLIHPVVCPG